jgi:antitoxin PrlF
MPSFAGSITTTGKSEAIRLDKALFRLHPEFRQKARVRAQVISPGHALIAVVDEGAPPNQEEDPVVSAFLGFLEKDLKQRPGRRTRLSKASLRRAVRLARRVSVSDGETLPDKVTF